MSSKFAKSAIVSQKIFFSQKNQQGYHKMQNFMLILDMLKSLKGHPKKIIGWKML